MKGDKSRRKKGKKRGERGETRDIYRKRRWGRESGVKKGRR